VGEDAITIVNAGLPPVAVVHDGAVTALVGPNGAPPGLFEESTYDSIRVERRPGMRLVVMSDGLTEAFGLSDCTEATAQRLGLLDGAPTSRELEAGVRGLLSGANSAHADDATLLVLSDERGPPRSRGSKGDKDAR
jgi:serine phosphatase RsbU (regulator of sigma subunit)